MNWRKARIITRLEVLSATMRDDGRNETARLLKEARNDMDNIWDISDIVTKAQAGKGLIGNYEFNRKVDEMAKALYEKMGMEAHDGEDFFDLANDVQEEYRETVREILSMLK